MGQVIELTQRKAPSEDRRRGQRFAYAMQIRMAAHHYRWLVAVADDNDESLSAAFRRLVDDHIEANTRGTHRKLALSDETVPTATVEAMARELPRG
jgi:hypothetical protein